MWPPVRNGSDAHLQRRAVLDQGCAVASDGRLDLIRLREFGLDQRGVVLHEQVDLRQRDHRLSESAGNILVHHGDHIVGTLHGGQRSVDRRTQRYITVLVGRADLNHRHIARNGSAAIQFLRFAQEDGNVVGIAALRHLADVRAHEERVELEHALEFGIGIGCRTLGVQVMDMHVLQFAGFAALAHRVDQTLGG